MTFWAAAALYFDVRVSWLRLPLAVLYSLAVLAVWILARRRWLATGLTVGGFALVLGWWFTLQPSNDRDWQPDVALLSYAEINGSKVTVHNIRNCDYRTETDFDVRHYDKTFDLDRLRTADLFMVYWGSPHMAHTMVSFGFEGGEHVCFSIETRKEKGEGYSAVKGLFRQFELTYVAADERDVVRLRTNYRGEDVYVYRLHVPPERARALLLDYVATINALAERPQWYNALLDNCTTGIRVHATNIGPAAPWDWRILANGTIDEMLYERGRLDDSRPFAELRRASWINARARAADADPEFSRRIREPDQTDTR